MSGIRAGMLLTWKRPVGVDRDGIITELVEVTAWAPTPNRGKWWVLLDGIPVEAAARELYATRDLAEL